jgi:hypothetical protein
LVAVPKHLAALAVLARQLVMAGLVVLVVLVAAEAMKSTEAQKATALALLNWVVALSENMQIGPLVKLLTQAGTTAPLRLSTLPPRVTSVPTKL